MVKKLSLNMSPYKFRSQLMCPFGPRLGFFQLNENVVHKLLNVSEDILCDKSSQSAGNKLAGQISEELTIPIDTLKNEGLLDFFTRIMTNYVEMVDLGDAPSTYQQRESQPVTTEMQEMWIVRQYENEYNPVHWHPGSTLSGVLYLKVPPFQDREIHSNGKKNQDGRIVFINNNPSDPKTSLENATSVFHPVVGDLFIWPSRLMHCVYPFQGPGERRCIAFNGIHRYA